MTSKQTHNRAREDARNCALSFCGYTVREKETTTHKERDDKTKSRSQAAKRTSQGQQRQSPRRYAKKMKKGKNRGKHATSHITAKHLTHTKAPQSTQNPNPIQTYIRTPKPSKNPLKMRNIAIFKCNAPQAKQESGQKAWNTPQEDQSQPPAGPEASKACRPLDQWTR